jgi:transposase
MGAPYSEDLRRMVLRAIDEGMGKMTAHKTFGISRSPIDDWLLLRSQHGSVKVLPRQRGKRATLLGAREAFAPFALRHAHSTLGQMQSAWQEETGQPLSLNTFSLALRHIGWTRKKRALSMPSATSKNGLSS